eukprot:gnl/TRDRNA2_/TRDRNA2_189245_c0_seq1.p1 gnl/TRDRNA2_/TRDRNA2_189245_c0~~gnl/TRDRNA2_/TRDRNA2_189245_c0_seq1.p1  ORF type:complete len:366 (-),score=65.34 gnl/TRDRNA2_/TRDRNA2_189245_c0_seq1:104-1201(-)
MAPASEMSNWPAPAPLAGVKSRKRAIFEVETGEIAIGNDSKRVSRITGVKLTLDSRIAAIGQEGQALVQLLLGERQLAQGKALRHDDLAVAHLGPHLAGCQGASVDELATAVAAALQARPQVIVLSESAAVGDDAWSRTFAELTCDSGPLDAFNGAVVLCVDEETPEARRICSKRWAGEAGWLWQEEIRPAHNVKIVENALAPESGLVGLPEWEEVFQEVRELEDAEFSESCAFKFESWQTTLLTEVDPSSGVPQLCGFICLLVKPSEAEVRITRLAVLKNYRKCGYGEMLMRWALVKAAKMPLSECGWISTYAIDNVVPFYERFGFMDMTCDDVDDENHHQTFMMLKNISEVELEDEEDSDGDR